VARVLIVDDDHAVRDVLVRVLERAHHEVEACGEAVTALALCRSWNPDLVVTDVFMPEMDGIEFLLRVLEERPGLPIIVISGGAQSTTPHLALEDAAHLGAISTLAKPFEMDELLAAVDVALSAPPST
jgi:CheY-like chemotaxis protein